jgi:RNA polymerase sigma-70 factor (ECF subfamily)
MDKTSASLLERLRGPRDPEAWARFVELYTPLLLSWAKQFGLRDADAADLVQDIYLLLLRKLPGFAYDRQQQFRSWLWTVAHNCWATRQRRSVEVTPAAGPEALPEPAAPDGVADLEEAEHRRYLVGRVLHLVQRDCQPATWQAFWQFVACDRPAEEVAAELGLTVAAVYAAKSRILRRLRNELRDLLH